MEGFKGESGKGKNEEKESQGAKLKIGSFVKKETTFKEGKNVHEEKGKIKEEGKKEGEFNSREEGFRKISINKI